MFCTYSVYQFEHAVFISGVAFGGMTQYFRPRPSRFFVPCGGWIFWHRLWTAMFVGCSVSRVLIWYLVPEALMLVVLCMWWWQSWSYHFWIWLDQLWSHIICLYCRYRLSSIPCKPSCGCLVPHENPFLPPLCLPPRNFLVELFCELLKGFGVVEDWNLLFVWSCIWFSGVGNVPRWKIGCPGKGTW